MPCLRFVEKLERMFEYIQTPQCFTQFIDSAACKDCLQAAFSYHFCPPGRKTRDRWGSHPRHQSIAEKGLNMKREFLYNLKVGDQALTKEVIDAIMAENGRDIEAAKAPLS